MPAFVMPLEQPPQHQRQMQFTKSQEHMDSFAVFLFLVVIPAFAIGGGAVGFYGYRILALRAREEADK